jgi:microcystin-dependent protein
MSDPFIGEIRMFAGNFAPRDWAFCAGQTLAISENDALFALIGTTYGGDGVSTFNLPDLRSRVPLHQGTSFVIGEMAGEENVTLTASQLPTHSHAASADANAGGQASPAGNLWAGSSANAYAAPVSIDTQMASGALGPAGGSQPHDNMVPFLTINFIICLFGIFPSRN